MAILRKADLLARFEEAVRLSDWNLLYLSNKGDHPARYRIFRDGKDLVVRVFIWNITRGGRVNLKDEYRIQNTGPKEIQPEVGARNLILGWWGEVGVFVGWDIREHVGPVKKFTLYAGKGTGTSTGSTHWICALYQSEG